MREVGIIIEAKQAVHKKVVVLVDEILPGQLASAPSCSLSTEKWVRIRDHSVWWASAVLTTGLTIMWTANISALLEHGGFTGIAGWLIPGIVVVTIRFWLLLQRLLKEWEVPKQRWRILAQLIPTAGNFLANGFAIGWIIYNLYTGALMSSDWDPWCYGVAGATLCVMIAAKLYRRERLSTKHFIAGIALGTRAFPQGMLTASPQLRIIPWGTPTGLALIAALQWLISLIEYKAAKEEQSKGVREAHLLVWADASNLLAAGILMVGWGILHFG